MRFWLTGHVGDDVLRVHFLGSSRTNSVCRVAHKSPERLEFVQVDVVVVEHCVDDEMIVDEAHGQHMVLEIGLGLAQLHSSKMAVIP